MQGLEFIIKSDTLYAFTFSQSFAVLCRFCRLRQNIDYAVRSRNKKIYKEKNREPKVLCLPLVEISGYEPLTS